MLKILFLICLTLELNAEIGSHPYAPYSFEEEAISVDPLFSLPLHGEVREFYGASASMNDVSLFLSPEFNLELRELVSPYILELYPDHKLMQGSGIPYFNPENQITIVGFGRWANLGNSLGIFSFTPKCIASITRSYDRDRTFTKTWFLIVESTNLNHIRVERGLRPVGCFYYIIGHQKF